MRHRATLYSVRVHERYKPTEVKHLGDIDGSGTYLADFLQGVFTNGFACESSDAQREVTTMSSALVEPDLQVMFLPGERGVRAEIMDVSRQLQFSRQVDHTHIVQCGSVFRLPRNETHGLWAAHVHSTSIKSLVYKEITEQFNDRFSDLVLTVSPSVNQAMLMEALENDRLLSVSLVKHDRSSDIADRGKWVTEDAGMKLELRIKPENGKTLLSTLVKKHFGGTASTLGEIVEFQGMHYDTAKCQVRLSNGIERSFNIEAPEAGHPMSLDIDPDLRSDGDPEPASLFSELQRVIEEV